MGKQRLTQKRFLRNICCTIIGLIVLIISAGITPKTFAQSDDPTPPSQPVKLIFIHHSCGENWLNDENGGLGHALGENNYFVSDTNYGWGPDAIGDRTDIVNWQEWFRSMETDRIMTAVFEENGQNSPYTRSLSDPGGENEIVMFKSCFPNSNLEGNPNDQAAPGDGLTVSNAKYIYNDLLQYFITRPDKLFIVITAPPVQDASLADNARAFNTWLVNDWLNENQYTYPNVAVFDFYNVLSGENNHHRYNQGSIEYINDRGGNTSAYASAPDDDHPSMEGNRKATTEFVPLLNIYYHRWKESDSSQTPIAPAATQTTPIENASEPETARVSTEGSIDDFETVPTTGEGWQFYFDEATDSILRCTVDKGESYQGDASLKIEFDIAPASWGTCTLPFNSIQNWRSGDGIGFYLHADQAGLPFNLLAQGGDPENRTTYTYGMTTPQESVSGWVYMAVSWDQLKRVEWEEGAGTPFDPAQTTGIAFGFDGLPEGRVKGIMWVDDIQLIGLTEAPAEVSAEPLPEAAEEMVTSEPIEEEQPQKSVGCCRGIAFIPLPVVGLLWLGRRAKR
jgi:hypothetical protein